MSEPIDVVAEMRSIIGNLRTDTTAVHSARINTLDRWIVEVERLQAKVKELEAENARAIDFWTGEQNE